MATAAILEHFDIPCTVSSYRDHPCEVSSRTDQPSLRKWPDKNMLKFWHIFAVSMATAAILKNVKIAKDLLMELIVSVKFHHDRSNGS
jgi:hypothetical protein